MDNYVKGRGFMPSSNLPKGKPVRGMKQIKNKPEYAHIRAGEKPKRTRKATTRRKVAHTNTKPVSSRPKKQLPKKRRGGFWGLFG